MIPYKQKKTSILPEEYFISPFLFLTMGYVVLERFCLTLKAIHLATRHWETKMHGAFNACAYFFINFPSFLQHEFLGEGCRACSGFTDTDLKCVVKVL